MFQNIVQTQLATFGGWGGLYGVNTKKLKIFVLKIAIKKLKMLRKV